MFKQILLGLFIAFLGSCTIYYSSQLTDIIGRINRAEKNLGGTRKAFVLFGFIIIIIGFLILFGMISLSGSPTDIQGFQPKLQ